MKNGQTVIHTGRITGRLCTFLFLFWGFNLGKRSFGERLLGSPFQRREKKS